MYELVTTAIYEAFCIIINVIFFAYLNVGKIRPAPTLVYLLNIIVMVLLFIFTGKVAANIWNFISIILYCTFCSKSNRLSVRFFMGITACILLLISDFASAMIFLNLNIVDSETFYNNFQEVNEIHKKVMMTILSTVMMSLSVILSLFHSKKSSTKLDKLLIFTPIQQMLIVLLVNTMITHYKINTNDPLVTIIYTFTASFGMISNIIIIRVSQSITEKQIIQQKNSFYEYYDKINTEYTGRTETALREIRKIRHDFNNHLQVINSLIETNDTQNASEMITQLKDKYSAQDINSYSSNHVMNIILSSTAELCRNNDIEFVCDCSMPPELDSCQLDISSITSNILQNAYEAAVKAQSQKKISFSAHYKNNMFFIKCINTRGNAISYKNNKLHTTKPDYQNHGFGMEIIEHTAAAYNGNVITEHDDNSFTILVQMNINNSSGIRPEY